MMRLAPVILIVVCCCSTSLSYAGARLKNFNCFEHDKYGFPHVGNTLLCRTAFMVGMDTQARIPDFAVYRLTKDSVDRHCQAQPGFTEDPNLTADEQANSADYRHQHKDKGHLAPRATMDISCQSEREATTYSNAVPQDPIMNRFGWRILEKRIRWLADSLNNQPVYVITGDIHGPESRWMHGRVIIPDYLYKIVYVPSAHQSIAFLFPNTPLHAAQLRQGILTVEQFEQKVGFTTFDIPLNERTHIGPIFNTLYR